MEYIYKITSPSNRIYIGKTKNINKRVSYYKKGHCKTQILLYNSIIKYTWENHIFEILESNILNANEREKYWIEYYKCNLKKYPKNKGLNLASGGQGNDSCSVKVYEYNIEGEFLKEWNSQIEASVFYNMKTNHIPGACNGRLKTFAGKRWSYIKVSKLEPLINRRTDTKYYNIIQINKSTNKIVKVWNNVGDIVRHLNFNHSGIINCINKKRPTYKGYIWSLT